MRAYHLRARRPRDDSQEPTVHNRACLWRALRGSPRVVRRWPVDLLRLVADYVPCLRDERARAQFQAGAFSSIEGMWDTEEAGEVLLLVNSFDVGRESNEFWRVDVGSARVLHRWVVAHFEDVGVRACSRGGVLRNGVLVMCARLGAGAKFAVVRLQLSDASTFGQWSVVLDTSSVSANVLRAAVDSERGRVWVLCKDAVACLDMDGRERTRIRMPRAQVGILKRGNCGFFGVGSRGTPYALLCTLSPEDIPELEEERVLYAITAGVTAVARLAPGVRVVGVDEALEVVYYTRQSNSKAWVEAAELSPGAGVSRVHFRSATHWNYSAVHLSRTSETLCVSDPRRDDGRLAICVYASTKNDQGRSAR